MQLEFSSGPKIPQYKVNLYPFWQTSDKERKESSCPRTGTAVSMPKIHVTLDRTQFSCPPQSKPQQTTLEVTVFVFWISTPGTAITPFLKIIIIWIHQNLPQPFFWSVVQHSKEPALCPKRPSPKSTGVCFYSFLATFLRLITQQF